MVRLALSILLACVFVGCAAANGKVLASFLVRRQAGSMLPLMGGVTGVGAALISPVEVVHKLWWMPLLLDAGTAWWLIFSLVRLFPPAPRNPADGPVNHVIKPMCILQNLKLRLSPPRITDPDFGDLVFMFVANAPERSYWECEWKFPKTGTEVSIVLPGDQRGPLPEARQFYLNLPGHFDQILSAARPQLHQVFTEWFSQDLPQDIFKVVKLTGFGLEDARRKPVHWDISFETTGDKWLGIMVPFVGDTAQKATVDT